MNASSHTRSLRWPLALAVVITALIWTFQSWWRWSHFQYTTFDLAFYVQALDGFSHGRNWSSLLGVQPFGNHADFIILLLWPIYAVFHHPITLVAVQSLALAACLPLGWCICLEAGWNARRSLALAAILLVNPVITFVAIHEFHPEAFAAPLWLAVYLSWQRKDQRLFWITLVLFLSCKENLGLVAGTWFLVRFLTSPRDVADWKWSLWPGLFTGIWMAVYLFWLGPKWNAGNVDFGALYSHLREKGLMAGALGNLSQSLRGNLIWALLLPMLLLPLRRPLAVLPALPILLQHLLSWRSSEWGIYFHYAAPLLPVFWIAAVEALDFTRETGAPWFRSWPCWLLVANGTCFFAVGTPSIFFAAFSARDPILDQKRAIVESVPANASILAPLPFLSQLAQRSDVYSLHLVMKGLKTLSRQVYTPASPTDLVILDYSDPITFDSVSGYYHPAMRLRTGTIVPSSDVLIHQFLARAEWEIESVGPLTVWTKTNVAPSRPAPPPQPLQRGLIDPATDLVSVSAINNNGQIQVITTWSFRSPRNKIPWMTVAAMQPDTGEKRLFVRGLACPEGRPDGTTWTDTWNLPADFDITPGEWNLLALFTDNASHAYARKAAEPQVQVIVKIPWK